MKIAVFSSRPYEQAYLRDAAAGARHELVFLESRLSIGTAALANGCVGAAIFVCDDASAPVLEALHAGGVRALLLRSAGFNHVDLAAAERLGITVLRVPAYSPHAVAEHAVGLMLTLNRKYHRAFNRVREQNFSLDGLVGFDMRGKTAGIVGAGKIGEIVCRILTGFGCEVLVSDPAPATACLALGARQVGHEELFRRSDIVSLHCPLTPATRHMVNAEAIASMKPGVMIINTSRGAVIDTRALIGALKRGHVGGVGLDVYEEEGDLFFRDLSNEVISDDVFVRLMTFPNVLITAHQGFLTREALSAIAETTLRNADGFESGRIDGANRVGRACVAPAP